MQHCYNIILYNSKQWACLPSLSTNERTGRRLLDNGRIRYIIISLTRITLRSFYFKEILFANHRSARGCLLVEKIIIDILNSTVLLTPKGQSFVFAHLAQTRTCTKSHLSFLILFYNLKKNNLRWNFE